MCEFQRTLLDYWREETMGDFFRNLEKVCANFQKTILAGGNYGGFFRNLEKACVNFKRNNSGGRKLWELIPEIWGRYARISRQ